MFLAAPAIVTAQVSNPGAVSAVLIGISWAGLLLAAAGDLTKSIVKSQLGADTLVVSGVFRYFRHPNYTGEQILWTSSMLAAFAAAITGGVSVLRSTAGWLVGSLIGWAGIFFVLAKATANLEKKQAKRFDAFQKWKQSAWGGISLSSQEGS
jgi:steroid 5-alpha reductase family enzyme